MIVLNNTCAWPESVESALKKGKANKRDILMVATVDGNVSLWCMEEKGPGTCLWKMDYTKDQAKDEIKEENIEFVEKLCFSESTGQLVCASSNQNLSLYNLRDDFEQATHYSGFMDSVLDVHFYDGGKKVRMTFRPPGFRLPCSATLPLSSNIIT